MTPNPYYIILLTLFAIVAYMISVDQNVAEFIILQWQILRIKVSRFVFLVTVVPALLFETFMLKRNRKRVPKKYFKMAEEVKNSVKIDDNAD